MSHPIDDGLVVQVAAIKVIVYPLPIKSYDVLVNQRRSAKSSGFTTWMQEVKPMTAILFLKQGDNVKYGSFKGMRRATIDPLPFEFEAQESWIAVKQAYRRKVKLDEVRPLDVCRQVEVLSQDVLGTQWASALLSLVYDFIADEQQKPGLGHPPFDILQLRYVKVALATSIPPSDKSKEQEAYLLEELIDPAIEGKWRKYINNDSAIPIPYRHLGDQQRGEFLAFCQHVQYWKTNKLVFVSDFQGKYSFFIMGSVVLTTSTLK